MYGYAGRILHVDLTSGKTSFEPLKEDFARKYFGATGFGIKLLMEHQKPGVDPLGPDNVLIFIDGPLAGTMAPTAGNGFGVFAKSPATNFIGEAYSHGYFGGELKRAGYDAIVIKGRAPKPTYLWIDDDAVELMDASAYWGKTTWEAETMLKDDHGDHYVRVSLIGPAGENLCRFASIMNDTYRSAGRTGLGAVMGSKKLKAIAVRGSKDVKVADPEGLYNYCKDLYERCKGPKTLKYRTLGTPENVLVLNRLAALPTRNWQAATFEGAEKVSGEYLNERFVGKIVACLSCPMRCEHIAVVDEGPYKGTIVRVEYQPLNSFGPICGIDRLDAIIKCIELADLYGMDSISTGVVVGFAMECFEKGLITEKDTEGLELTFGNHEAAVETVRKIAYRQAIGDVLAEGVMRAAEKIGGGAEQFAMHIKGLEITNYDIRGLKTAALGYAVSRRGADHQRHGSYSPDVKGTVDRFKAEKGRGKIVADMEDQYVIVDSAVLCKFSRGIWKWYDDVAKLYNLVTGFDMTPEEMNLVGTRVNTLARLYNIREGLTRKDDRVPIRVMKLPIPEGVAKGSYVSQEDLDLLLDDYYEYRGWDKDGIPTEATLKELGLEEYAYLMGKEG